VVVLNSRPCTCTRQILCHWATHIHGPFGFKVVLQIGSHIFAWGQPQTSILPTYNSRVAGITDVSYHTQLHICLDKN
jgi:hypothetical protein